MPRRIKPTSTQAGSKPVRNRWNRSWQVGLVLGGLIAVSAAASAQTGAEKYPERPVRVVVPFAAGGGTDVLTRLTADELTRALGKSFYIENVPGAGGMTATTLATRGDPDGYTLFATSPGPITIYPALSSKLSYDADKNVQNISVISEGPGVAVVAKNSRFQSLKDVIAEAKAKPGTVTVASSGIGAFSHMNCELFKALAGVNVIHVPYRGAGPAATDIMGGVVDMTIEYFPAVGGLIESGQLRALAVTTASRYPLRPDIPTFEDEGVKGYATTSWVGLAAPAGTPRPVIDKLYGVVAKASKEKAFVERLRQLGVVAIANSPDEARAYLAKERETLRTLGKSNGITLD
jgi:tripartite-type tricarboxylate transporter receptor subunit TctC